MRTNKGSLRLLNVRCVRGIASSRQVVRRIQKYSDSAAIEADVLRDVGLRASTHPGGTDLMVAMLAQFEFAGHFCMVFESLGRSLYDYLKTNDYRPFPYAMVVDFAQQLLAAVDFLHKMNLCHTDLKVNKAKVIITVSSLFPSLFFSFAFSPFFSPANLFPYLHSCS